MVKNDLEPSNITPSSHLLLGSFVAIAILIFVAGSFFEPRWETNDDVAMSMVAHGYGLAEISSPNLIFSNVLWGYFVRALPEIGGVLGYSIAAVGALLAVGTSIAYGLIRVGLGYLATLLILILILIRPGLFPQFTINSGLLMVGAIVCWHLFARYKDQRALAIGCLLAFCSYLVRSQEFLLVLLVALPLLPWRVLLTNRTPKIAVVLLVTAIAISAQVDRQAYLGDDWIAFNELNPTRAALTDFGAGSALLSRPVILEQHGYSSNDIRLVGSWFFVDPKIANPPKLKAMLDELGPLPSQGNAWGNAWVGVETLWAPALLPVVLAALLLVFLRPSWSVIGCWGLCIAAVAAIGFVGRPGVVRIYVPLVSFLVIAPFFGGKYPIQSQKSRRRHLEIGVLVIAATVNTLEVFSEAKASRLMSEQARVQWRDFPRNPVVVWGSAFPFETMYPALRIPPEVKSFRLYGLGVFTLAPFSVPYSESSAGRGMVSLLLSENGADIVLQDSQIELLEGYCIEHHKEHRLMWTSEVKGVDLAGIRNFRCRPEILIENTRQDATKER